MASATKGMLVEETVEVPDQALDAIGRKYHARMRTVDASSDSLSDGVVVPALREAIVEGVLAPGSRLSEVQVAKQLNVSRTPMREAFACLAVQLSAQNITALGRAQLEDVIEEMRAGVVAEDPPAYVDALDRFYSIVMTIADNRTLQATHASLIGPVRRLRPVRA